jgi:hypothetical protein
MIAQEYGINVIPKLLVFDVKTGELLNENLQSGLIEYVHEFCNKQYSSLERNNEETHEEEFRKTKQTCYSNSNDTGELYKKDNFCFDLNFNLDFDIGDMTHYRASSDRIQLPKSKVKQVNNSTTNVIDSSPFKERKKKYLTESLLKELNENLVDISNREKKPVPDWLVESISGGEQINVYHLLYFCSNFTASKASMFNQVAKFLNYMQEKIECIINIVLISSDYSEEDYTKLTEKFDDSQRSNALANLSERSNDEGLEAANSSESSYFRRYIVDFKCKHIKESLFKELNVIGIPWFSLINALSGEILCENLKIFILNSQLREMIF